MIDNLFKKLFLFLFFVTLPLYVISSLRISAGDLSITINFILIGVFLAYLIFPFARKSAKLYFDKPTMLLVGLMSLLLIYYLIIILFSPSLSFALDTIIRFAGAIILTIVGYVISNILIRDKKSFFSYLNLTIIASTIFIFALIVVYSLIFHSAALGTEFGKIESGGRNQMQVYLVILIPFIVYSYVQTRKKYLLLALLVHLIAVLYIGSRGVIISLALVAFLYFLFYLFRLSYNLHLSKRKIKLLALLIFFILLSLGAMIFLITYANIETNYLGDRFLALVGLARDTGSIGVRENLVLTGVALFSKNPIIGGGFGSFVSVTESQGERLLPHNDYLLFLADTGTIGLILFLIIQIYMIILFFNKKLPLYLILPFFVDLLFIDAYSFPLFWILVGLVLGGSNDNSVS